MAKRKNRKRKEQSQISKILNLARSENQAAHWIFQELTAGQLKSSIPKLAKSRFFTRSIKLTLGENPKEIYYPKTPNYTFEKNLAWCLGLVEYHKEIITYCLEQEPVLSKSIRSKQFQHALDILDSIDSTCGYSLWSLKIRAGIANKSDDKTSTEINSFIKNLITNSGNSFLLLVLSKSTSNMESGAHDPSARAALLDIERSAPPVIKEFLTYHLFKLNFLHENDFEKVIQVEKNSSIIDIFFFLIDLVCQFSTNRNSDTENHVSKLAISLSNLFDYPILSGTSPYLGSSNKWTFNEVYADLLDHYTIGNYEYVCKKAEEIGIENLDIPILEIAAKSNIRCEYFNDDAPGTELIFHFQNILLKNKSTRSSLESISSVSHNLRSLRWYREMSYFYQREHLFTSEESRKSYENLTQLASSYCTPKYINAMPPSVRLDFFDFYSKHSANSPTLELFKYVHGENYDEDILDKIDPFRLSLYRAQRNFNSGDYNNAIEICNGLRKSDDRLISIESSRLLVSSLLANNLASEAVSTFIDLCLSDKNLLWAFDIEKVLSHSRNLISSSMSITIPIAYSLHSRYIDSTFDSELKYAFECFLLNNSFKFPQELFGREPYFGNRELKYFLKWVCIPEVMKLYLEFESAKDVEQCRKEICTYLMDTGEESEAIQNELKSITKSLILKKAQQKVESSRIYADTSSLLGRNSQQYRTLFDRYLKLASENTISDNQDEQFSFLLEQLKEISEETGKSVSQLSSTLHLLNIKLSQKNSVFLNLANLVRTEFTFGDKGLNNHLSTRIRHGVLPTALREPLSNESLFVPESMDPKNFIEQSKWMPEMILYDIEDTKSLGEALSDFTKEYEALISEINDEWLQISTLDISTSGILDNSGNKPKAKFLYLTSALECYGLQNQLPISPSYEDFVKIAIEWLWEKTDHLLEEVQLSLITEAKPKALQLIENLKVNIKNSYGDNPLVSQICNAADRCRSALSNQFDVICSWFNHTDINDDELFDLETSILIAKTSLNTQVKLENDVNFKVTEKTLIYFVDIFFILIENAISKSGLEKSKLDLQIKIHTFNNHPLLITVTNRCKLKTDLEAANRELDFYRERYGNESLIKGSLQEEGGTGFFKIWKILARDLEVPHKIDLKFTEEESFHVEINLLDIQSILKNESSYH